jgi:hypothetical protein
MERRKKNYKDANSKKSERAFTGTVFICSEHAGVRGNVNCGSKIRCCFVVYFVLNFPEDLHCHWLI